jgi:hypothetical protein
VATDHPAWDTLKTVCPLRCRLRHAAASDNPTSGQPSTPDEVDWAGLPIDLDFAFSAVQRDNVYLQHLRRKRGAQLRRWGSQDGAQPCPCDIAAAYGHEHDNAKTFGITP